jgi:gluconokinase
VLAGGTDEEIFAWCQQHGRGLNEIDLLVWNAFASKRGWRDEATVNLDKNKADSGLAHRTDLQTFFDYYEVDEGRAPR